MATAWTDRLLAQIGALHAHRTTRAFLRALDDAAGVQQRLLLDVLRRSVASDFGRTHRFDEIRGYADFVRRVPITAYAGLAPYIHAVMEGRVEALFNPGTRILMFALTSGTTAAAKYIPITPAVLAQARAGWNVWGLRAILDHPGTMLRSILQVTSPARERVAPSGAPCGAITGLLAATQKRIVRRYYTAPAAVADIADATAKYYTLMRLAVPRDVAFAVTANPATLLMLARTADRHKEALIRDVRDGTLRGDFDVPSGVRTALRPLLRPDPAAARRLEVLAARHGALYPRHYWNLGFVAHWTGGTMGLYRPQFAPMFGGVPVRDVGLIASEGRMSIPLEDNTPAGVLAVTSQFFEFIPADEYGSSSPTTLRSDQVQPGGEYFLLLTNASGLFRYDIGDRVRVTGRQGGAPMIEFLSRDAHTSSLAGEKLTEDQVVSAMQHVCERLGAAVSDFVLAARWADVPGYRLYVEAADAPDPAALAARLDEALCELNIEYASKRKSLRLVAVQAAVLPTGFLAERDLRLRMSRSPATEQFKHQYLLPGPGADADLEAAASVSRRAPAGRETCGSAPGSQGSAVRDQRSANRGQR